MDQCAKIWRFDKGVGWGRRRKASGVRDGGGGVGLLDMIMFCWVVEKEGNGLWWHVAVWWGGSAGKGRPVDKGLGYGLGG